MDITIPNPGLPLTYPDMVVEDRQRHLFRVARRAFTDEEVLEQERRQIFDRCWLYLGHSSEIRNTCDFITRAVGGRELIFNRDRGGAVHAFLNTCPHRGAMVVREKKGNAVSLSDYLAGAKEYIDLVADHSEAGMEIVGSGQQYIINANWKLLAENSIDAFHGFPVHSTYFDYLKSLGSLRSDGFNAKGMTSLGNGHAVIEYASPWGRPIARWV